MNAVKAYKANGHSDWRLPTVSEYASMMAADSKKPYNIDREQYKYWALNNEKGYDEEPLSSVTHYDTGYRTTINGPRYTHLFELLNSVSKADDKSPSNMYGIHLVRSENGYDRFIKEYAKVDGAVKYAEADKADRAMRDQRSAKQQARMQADAAASVQAMVTFQKSIKVGSRAYQGTIMEIKGNNVKIDTIDCGNGVYQTHSKCLKSVGVHRQVWVSRTQLTPAF
jgi:hypothetical protein